MTTAEFSNEFDVLYNNIMSNQAPGLNEYEKSVFLTKAQNELVKNYFNKKSLGNQEKEGFDENPKRQIDFSYLISTQTIGELDASKTTTGAADRVSYNKDNIQVGYKYADYLQKRMTAGTVAFNKTSTTSDPRVVYLNLDFSAASYKPFYDILFPLNETVSVMRDYSDTLSFDTTDANSVKLIFSNPINQVNLFTNTLELTVVPVDYLEYNRLMSKPYKRPLKWQAWRLLNTDYKGYNEDTTTTTGRTVLLLLGPNDIFIQYTMRFVRAPRAIRLDTFDTDVKIGGSNTVQECELDASLHPEILQRAVELAKIAYIGDAKDEVQAGTRSE